MANAALSVLIVDDEPGDQMLEKIALSEQAFQCETRSAESVEDAINVLNDCATQQNGGHIDVVLLDGHLREKLATDVIDHIKSHDALKDVHVVVLTGSINKSEHSRFLECGADAVLEKTTDFEELIRTLSTLGRYTHAA